MVEKGCVGKRLCSRSIFSASKLLPQVYHPDKNIDVSVTGWKEKCTVITRVLLSRFGVHKNT